MASPRTTTRTRLGLECLQARVVPAVVVTQVDLDGDGAADDLRIVGDGAKNLVTVADNGSTALTLSIDANGDGDLTDAADVNGAVFNYSGNSVGIEVGLAGGNDAFTYSLQNSVAGGSRTLQVGLGTGNNAFTLDAANKNFTAGSLLDVDVAAGAGADAATVAVGQVRASLAAVRFDLGAGNDSAAVALGRIDDGGAADVAIDLGDGTNSAAVDLHEVGFGDRANASVAVTGGTGVDAVAVNLHDDVGDGVKASAVLVDVSLGAGNDTFAANLDYDQSVFRVDDHSLASINVRGGAGNDTLTAQGVGAAGTIRIDPDGLLDINLKGGTGDDTVAVNLGLPGSLEILGTVRAVIDGGAGKDKLSASFANNSNTTGRYDVAVFGGADNDQVAFGLVNNGGTPTFGPLGKVILKGGTGADTLTNGNPAVSLATYFETLL